MAANDTPRTAGFFQRSREHARSTSGNNSMFRRYPRGWKRMFKALPDHSPSKQFAGGQSNPTFKLITPAAQLCDAIEARTGGEVIAIGACDRT